MDALICGVLVLCWVVGEWNLHRARTAQTKPVCPPQPAVEDRMTCGNNSGLRHYVEYVKACARAYHNYLSWPEGDIQKRQFHMKSARAEWEMAGAIYRVHRRTESIRNAMKYYFGGTA